jgi:hypothetical protein
VTIDELAAGKYISLATYKRDGTPVATPVWVMRDADHLYVITDADSGKAKRLRNSTRAKVAPCDARGTPSGEAVDATAVLLDEEGTKRVEAMVHAKYGLMTMVFGLLGRVRSFAGRGERRRIGIEITLNDC